MNPSQIRAALEKDAEAYAPTVDNLHWFDDGPAQNEALRKAYMACADKLLPIVENMIAALEFYGDKDNWHLSTDDCFYDTITDDEQMGDKYINGRRAREALAKGSQLLAELGKS